jgi:quercetin dioxygenase-like cupin family protein
MYPVRIATIAGTIALLAMTAVAGAEEKKEYKAPGATTEQILHQSGLAAGEKLEAKVIRVTMPAGYQGGKHYHTGDLVVYVQSGSLTAESAEGTRTYGAGEAFYEIPGQTMRAVNKSAGEDTVLVVFQVGKQGEPLMVKAK